MKQSLPTTILVPTDFSDASRQALHRAAALAQACSATLTVIYADRFTPPDENDHESMEQSRKAATTRLQEEIRREVPPNVPVDAFVVVDTPVRAILNVAKEKNIDWIVMGPHGRTGITRLFLGSVTEQVLRQADRPVLAVRAA